MNGFASTKNLENKPIKKAQELDLVNILSNVIAPIPLAKLMKIPSLYEKVRNLIIKHPIGPSPQNMNIINDYDHVLSCQETSHIAPRHMSFDVKTLKKSFLNSLDEETREEIREAKCEEH